MAKIPLPTEGWSGTSIQQGVIRGIEDNPDLRYDSWPLTAQRMIMTDGAIYEGISAHTQTALSADWHIAPGREDSPFAKELADKTSRMLGLDRHGGLMHKSFEDIVGQFMMFAHIGFRYGSMKWEYIPGFGQALVDILDRAPSAHYKWNTCNDKLVSVTQKFAFTDGSYDYGHQPVIPAEQLLLLVKNPGAGNSYNGLGNLRPCYIPFKLKYHSYDIMGVALETWGHRNFEIFVDWPKAKEDGYSQTDLQRDYETAQEAVEQYRSHNGLWISSSPYVQVRMIGGDFQPSAPVEVIREMDIQLARPFLTSFLNLGITDTGSRSVGEVTESFFRRAIQNDLDVVKGGFNGPCRPGGGVFARWASYAIGEAVPAEYLPKLQYSGLSPDPLIEYMEKFGLSTWLTETLQDKNRVRAAIGMDPLPDKV